MARDEGKTYVRGTMPNNYGLVPSRDHYVALAETSCSTRKCDRDCQWPYCSKDWRVFNDGFSANSYVRNLELSGATVETLKDEEESE